MEDAGPAKAGYRTSARFWRLGGGAALTFFSYLLTAALGLQWALTNGAASPIWPAAGISLAAVVVGGRRMAIPIALALVLAMLLTDSEHPLWVMIAMGLGNAGAAVIGSALLRRFTPEGQPWLNSLQGVFALVAAASVAAVISASVGSLALVVARDVTLASFEAVFEAWLFGDLVGILLVGAFLLVWFPQGDSRPWKQVDGLHLFLTVVAVALLGYLVFFGEQIARAWAIYPALVWAALLLRTPGAVVTLVVAGIVATAGTLAGAGPFAPVGPGVGPDLLLLQQFLAVTSATTLLLAAAVGERDAEVRLREARDREIAARSELARAEAILGLVTGSAPIAIYAKDSEGRYLYANATVAAAVSLPREHLLGKTDEIWTTRGQAAVLRENDLQAMAAKRPIEIEEVLTDNQGLVRSWRSLKAPLRDQAGDVIGIVGVSLEITQQKAQEEALARRTAELETLLTSAPIGLAYFSRDCRYVRVNQALAETNGLPIDRHLGRTVEEVMGRPTPRVAALIEQVFATGEPVPAVEMDGATPTAPGEVRHWLTGFFPVRALDGSVASVGCWIVEITERKMLEERERLLAREVDHRAKNLLSIVQSVVQLSRADEPSIFRASVMGRIQSLARAHSLLAAGRWEGVELNQLVGEELAPYTSDRQDRVIVQGSRLQLRPAAAQSIALAIHELATNAAKYGALRDPAGSLHVHWDRTEDGGLELVWRERGVTPVNRPVREGFGSRVIAASLERQLGGTVSRDWRDDGLEIRIGIPSVQLVSEPIAAAVAPPEDEPDAPAPAQRPASDPSPTRRGRVLIVEDEALIGLQVEDALTDRGFEIVGIAASVAEALQMGADAAIDAAILDINLGGETSFPVADALLARKVRMVFCTGYDGDRQIPAHLAHLPVLRKPFDPDEVAEALR